MPELNTASQELSPEEVAYFESGGETEVKELAAEITNEEVPTIPEAAVENNEGQDKPRDEKGKFVPHQALHAEREEHKKTKSELAEIARKQAILEDRWNTLLKLREEPQHQEETPPDPEQDIFAAFKWQQKQLEGMREAERQRQEQTQQAQHRTSQEQMIQSEWTRSVSEFSAQTPDFKDAAKFLADARMKMYETLAVVDPQLSTPEGRNQRINDEVSQLVIAAKQNNMSPAELVYNLAKQSGYAGAAPQAQTLQLPDKLAGIEAAQRASQSLTASGGQTGADPLTAESIASMDTQEFNKWYESPENQARYAKILRQMK